MLGVNRAEFNGEENFRINTNPLSEKRCKWENQNSLKMASQAYRELLSHFRVVIGKLLTLARTYCSAAHTLQGSAGDRTPGHVRTCHHAVRSNS